MPEVLFGIDHFIGQAGNTKINDWLLLLMQLVISQERLSKTWANPSMKDIRTYYLA